MPTRKELIEDLLSEMHELRSSMSDNADASESLRSEVDHLQSEISAASDRLARISDRTIEEFSDRIADLREALKEGAREVGASVLGGHLVGGIVGQAIATAIQNKQDDPQDRMARRINQALHIINNSFTGGSRNDYEATLRLLRVHEFGAEQARYIVDLLLRYKILMEFEDDGTGYLMLDPENATLKQMQEHYEKGTMVCLP